MRMSHQRLDRPKIIPFIQEGGGEGMTCYMRVNSFPDQGLFCQGFDETIDSLRGKRPLLVRTTPPERVEHWMVRICPIPGGLEVIFYGKNGLGRQGDSSELLAFADDVHYGLVTVGL